MRAELVTMLPALRDVINWRQNHCGPLENEVQGLVNAKMDLMGDVTTLQSDVNSLRRELSAYDADLKKKLSLSEASLMAKDGEITVEIGEVHNRIAQVKSLYEGIDGRLGGVESAIADLGTMRAAMSGLQLKAAQMDHLEHRISATESGMKSAGVNWPNLVNRLDDLEDRVTAGGGGGGPTGGARSFLPEKLRVPKVYSGKLEEWPDWRSDVEMWFDGCARGLGLVLSKLAVSQSDDPIDGLYMSKYTEELRAVGTDPMKVMSCDARVYEALKGMTDKEALGTVRGVASGKGFEAWRRICQQFEPGVAAARHGAFHRVTEMGEKPAKTTSDTRRLLVELDNRLRIAREVQGRDVADDLSNAVLEKMIDPTTRAFTSSHFGKPYVAYRREVMRFLNENMSSDTRMQVGAVGEVVQNQEETPDDADAWPEYEGNLAAIKGACWNCGVVGHTARDCPQGKGVKGKGKGGAGSPKGAAAKGAPKGKGKGGPIPGKGSPGKGSVAAGGKGKPAPPRDGCLICWGPHWARDCPQRAYSVDAGHVHGDWADSGAWPPPGGPASTLCNLKTVRPDEPEVDARCGHVRRSAAGRVAWKSGARPVARRAVRLETAITGAKFFPWNPEVPDVDAQPGCKDAQSGGSRDPQDSEVCPPKSQRDSNMGRVEAVELPRAAKEGLFAERFQLTEKGTVERGSTTDCGQGDAPAADGAHSQGGWTEQAKTLTVINPDGGIQAVSDGDWELVEAAIDSGATENVMAETALKGVKTVEGESSRRGVAYEVANGVRIPNMGEKRFVGISEEGVQKGLTCQICDVNRPLLSVSKIVGAGHKVVFSRAGSWIEEEHTGKIMALREDSGMYTLQMWVHTGAQAPF